MHNASTRSAPTATTKQNNNPYYKIYALLKEILDSNKLEAMHYYAEVMKKIFADPIRHIKAAVNSPLHPSDQAALSDKKKRHLLKFIETNQEKILENMQLLQRMMPAYLNIGKLISDGLIKHVQSLLNLAQQQRDILKLIKGTVDFFTSQIFFSLLDEYIITGINQENIINLKDDEFIFENAKVFNDVKVDLLRFVFRNINLPNMPSPDEIEFSAYIRERSVRFGSNLASLAIQLKAKVKDLPSNAPNRDKVVAGCNILANYLEKLGAFSAKSMPIFKFLRESNAHNNSPEAKRKRGAELNVLRERVQDHKDHKQKKLQLKEAAIITTKSGLTKFIEHQIGILNGFLYKENSEKSLIGKYQALQTILEEQLKLIETEDWTTFAEKLKTETYHLAQLPQSDNIKAKLLSFFQEKEKGYNSLQEILKQKKDLECVKPTSGKDGLTPEQKFLNQLKQKQNRLTVQLPETKLKEEQKEYKGLLTNAKSARTKLRDELKTCVGANARLPLAVKGTSLHARICSGYVPYTKKQPILQRGRSASLSSNPMLARVTSLGTITVDTLKSTKSSPRAERHKSRRRAATTIGRVAVAKRAQPSIGTPKPTNAVQKQTRQDNTVSSTHDLLEKAKKGKDKRTLSPNSPRLRRWRTTVRGKFKKNHGVVISNPQFFHPTEQITGQPNIIKQSPSNKPEENSDSTSTTGTFFRRQSQSDSKVLRKRPIPPNKPLPPPPPPQRKRATTAPAVVSSSLWEPLPTRRPVREEVEVIEARLASQVKSQAKIPVSNGMRPNGSY